MKFVLRLPGAGRIRNNKIKENVPWTGYRNYSIDTSFYVKIKDILSELQEKEHKVILISGGVGAFLYSEFSKNLGLSHQIHKKIGINIVNLLNTILLNFFIENKLNIYNKLVKPSEIDALIESSQNNFFVLKADENENHLSTDSLSADIARLISSDFLVYFKEGVPYYYAGFPKKTKLLRWKIDDLVDRASYFSCSDGNHYIIDFAAVKIIKAYALKTLMINPNNPEHIKNLCKGIRLENQFCTELVE